MQWDPQPNPWPNRLIWATAAGAVASLVAWKLDAVPVAVDAPPAGALAESELAAAPPAPAWDGGADIDVDGDDAGFGTIADGGPDAGDDFFADAAGTGEPPAHDAPPDFPAAGNFAAAGSFDRLPEPPAADEPPPWEGPAWDAAVAPAAASEPEIPIARSRGRSVTPAAVPVPPAGDYALFPEEPTSADYADAEFAPAPPTAPPANSPPAAFPAANLPAANLPAANIDPAVTPASATADRGDRVRTADADAPAANPFADADFFAVDGGVVASPPPAATPPAGPPVPEELRPLVAAIDGAIEAGEYLAAHRELSRLYWDRPDLRPVIQGRIDRTATSIYFRPEPHYMDPYEVQEGDLLGGIAEQFAVPWRYLATVNRVDPRMIRPGQQLKVLRGPFAAVAELSTFTLTVHAHGYYVRAYPVGIGAEHATPAGRFEVLLAEENPTYWGPDGNVIGADDPANPLGEVWIGLDDGAGGPSGYGLHGTIEPDSIGTACSAGCLRLADEDIAEVFALLEEGCEVLIRP